MTSVQIALCVELQKLRRGQQINEFRPWVEDQEYKLIAMVDRDTQR